MACSEEIDSVDDVMEKVKQELQGRDDECIEVLLYLSEIKPTKSSKWGILKSYLQDDARFRSCLEKVIEESKKAKGDAKKLAEMPDVDDLERAAILKFIVKCTVAGIKIAPHYLDWREKKIDGIDFAAYAARDGLLRFL